MLRVSKFDSHNDSIVSGDEVLVTDYGNHRMQVFGVDGSYKLVLAVGRGRRWSRPIQPTVFHFCRHAKTEIFQNFAKRSTRPFYLVLALATNELPKSVFYPTVYTIANLENVLMLAVKTICLRDPGCSYCKLTYPEVAYMHLHYSTYPSSQITKGPQFDPAFEFRTSQ